METTVDIIKLSALPTQKLALLAANMISTRGVLSQERVAALVNIGQEIQSRLHEAPQWGKVQFIIADYLLIKAGEHDPVRDEFQEAAVELLRHLKDVARNTEWGAEAYRKLKITEEEGTSPRRQLSPETAATFIKSMVKKWDI